MLPRGIGVAESAEAAAAIDEGRGEDVAVTQALAFAVQVVVDHREAVADAQVLGEVDVVTECVGKLDHHRIAHAGLRPGIEQRALHDAVHHVGAAFDQAIDDALVHAVAIEGDHDARVFVAVETKTADIAFGIAAEGEFVAGMNVAQRVGVGAVAEQLGQHGGIHAVLLEDVADGLAGMHGNDRPVAMLVVGRAVA